MTKPSSTAYSTSCTNTSKVSPDSDFNYATQSFHCVFSCIKMPLSLTLECPPLTQQDFEWLPDSMTLQVLFRSHEETTSIHDCPGCLCKYRCVSSQLLKTNNLNYITQFQTYFQLALLKSPVHVFTIYSVGAAQSLSSANAICDMLLVLAGAFYLFAPTPLQNKVRVQQHRVQQHDSYSRAGKVLVIVAHSKCFYSLQK